MDSLKINTKEDFIIKDLFNKIFQEIKKVKLPNGFPYVEHDKAIVKYYPNKNEEFIEKLKIKHGDLNNKVVKSELRENNISHSSFIEYVIMLSTFNHNYPYSSSFEVKDYGDINDFRFNLCGDLYKKYFEELPLTKIDLRNNLLLSNYADFYFYKYPTDSDFKKEYCFFTGASIEHTDEMRFIRRSNNQLVLEKYNNINDSNLLELYREIYNSCCILYPDFYEIIETYDEELIIYSDTIRLIYRNATAFFPDNNPFDLFDYPTDRQLKKSLKEYDIWQELLDRINDNHSDIGYKDDLEILLDTLEDYSITNSFQLLLLHTLIEVYNSLNSNFVEVLKNARKKFEDTSALNDVQFIQYLIHFYQNEILNSKYHKLAICKGVKFNKAISDLFVKILINLLKRKKIEYDKKLHENYIFNPNQSNIEFDNFIGSTKIPVRNKSHDTYLDKEETYLLMRLLKDDNVFLEGVSDTLLQKVTEALTGYSTNQLRKLGSDNNKIIKPTQKEKYDKIERVLKSILNKIKELKQL